MRVTWIKALALIAALGQTVNGAAMADQDLSYETWCIGRHLVEVPASFEVLENFGTLNAMQIEVLGAGDQEALDRLVTDRADALEAGRVEDDGALMAYRGRYRDSEVQVVAHELDFGQDPGTSFTWSEEAYVLRDRMMMRVTQVLSEDEEDGPRAQLLELARNVVPRSRKGAPKRAGACLPDALATVPHTTEAHGMTFAPGDADGAPVGLEITILSRSPEDPPLDPEMPRGSAPEPLSLAGLEGRMVQEPDRFGPSRIAVLAREARADQPAVRVQFSYYDQRAEPGAEPYTEAYVQTLWSHLLTTFRATDGAR